MKTQKLVWLVALGFAVGCGGGNGAKGSGGGAKSPDGEGENADSAGGSGDNGKSGGGEPEAKFTAPGAGARALEERAATLEFELTLTRDKAAGGMQAGKWSLDEQRSYEVLSSKGPAITGLK